MNFVYCHFFNNFAPMKKHTLTYFTNRMKKLSLLTVLLLFCLTMAGQTSDQSQRQVRYDRNALRLSDSDFLKSDEARRIGDQVLL